MGGMWIVAFVLQWILILLLAIMMIGVLRYLASLQKSSLPADRSRYEVGEHVDNFKLPDIHGHLFRSSSLIGQQRVVLFFLNPTCGPCGTAVKQIAELARREGGLGIIPWSFVLICSGEPSKIEQFVKSLPPDVATILVDKDLEVTKQYGVRSTPFAIAVDRLGEVYSQSDRPTSHWLYTVLDVAAPSTGAEIGYSQEAVPVLSKENLV